MIHFGTVAASLVDAAGSFTYDQTIDSLEAVRDRGAAA